MNTQIIDPFDLDFTKCGIQTAKFFHTAGFLAEMAHKELRLDDNDVVLHELERRIEAARVPEYFDDCEAGELRGWF